MFDLKSAEELCFMTLKSHAKSEEKLTCDLENGMRNLVNFHQNTFHFSSEVSKLVLSWDPFVESTKCMS